MPAPGSRVQRIAAGVVGVLLAGSVVAYVATRPGDGPVITNGPTPTAPEQVPYDPAALINRPIPAGAPADARSDAVVARLVENTRSGLVNVATGIETPPVYTVSPGDPFLTTWVGGEKVRFRVPAEATPGGGADHPLVLLDPQHPDHGEDVELRLFQASIDRDAGELYAKGASVGHYNNDGKRLNPDGSRSVGVPFLGGGTGSGLSILAGLIRPSEVAAGRIDHVIRFAYSAFDSSDRFRPPAVKTDQPHGGWTRDPDKAMDMGMRLQLDPEVDCDARTVPGRSAHSRETRFLRILCHALQRYGMVMMDGTTDGGVLIEMEGAETGAWESVIGATREGGYGYIVRAKDSSSDGLTRNDHSGIPWDRMRVIAENGVS